jgi:predicted acetyltransferase
MKDYFKILENKHSIYLSDNQKAWYIKKKEMLADGVFQEFPATLDEAFRVSLEGAYYVNEMTAVYEQKRIGFFPVDGKYDVNTAWDLGMNDHFVILFYQEIGPEIRFVDFYENRQQGLEHYVKILRDKGYRYGSHYLPHDGGVRDLSAKGNKYSDAPTREEVLWEYGVYNTVLTGKPSVSDGIEKVRHLFPRFRFNEETTKQLTDSLANYRKDRDKSTGAFKNAPKHDDNSHRADAVRVLALGYMGEKPDNDPNDTDHGVKIESYAFGN